MYEAEDKLLLIIKILQSVLNVLEIEIQNRIERISKDDKSKLENGQNTDENYTYNF
ncbi:MAG: hypothetical protein ACM3MI_09705 [Clostridiales bacterium]